MRIGIISSTVFKLPLVRYGGLEQVAYDRARGLQALGHQVVLFAPDGSACPGVPVFHFGPERIPERQAYNAYWKQLPACEVIIDDTWEKNSFLLKEEGRLQAPILAVMHAPVDTMYRALPNVPKFCAVLLSDDQRAHFEALHNRQGRTAYNPVDTDRYKPMTVKRNDRALFLARFSAIKGADIAIAACKEVGMPLDLVGDTQITNEPDYFHHCASLCDGDKIRMVGPETRGGTVLRYSQAHVMLHPNKRFREPFGLAPVEGMLCGCPVVAWDNGAMRETVLHGETGMVVKDDREFTDAVKYAMEGVSDQVRKRCREWAMRFDIATCAKRYEALCMEALNTGGW